MNNNKIKILNEDERGRILQIAKNVDVLRIYSKKGSKRANHFHKKSSHLCVLLSGSITYIEKPTNKSAKPVKIEIKPGDYFFTDRLVDHLMIFNEDSVFDCYSFGSRDMNDYESDLIRLDYDLEDYYNRWQLNEEYYSN